MVNQGVHHQTEVAETTMDSKDAATKDNACTEIPLEYYIVAIGIIGATDELSDYYRIEPMLPNREMFRHIAETLNDAGVFDADMGPRFGSLERAIEKLKRYLEANPEVREWPQPDVAIG
jgi:hypothetical protein